MGGKVTGVKHDQEKLRYDLLDPVVLELVVDVLTYGAKKYGDRNWEGGIDSNRLYAACLRHLEADRQGQFLDPETGMPHIAHALTNLHFLLALHMNDKLPGYYYKDKENAAPIPEDRVEGSDEVQAPATAWCLSCVEWCGVEYWHESPPSCRNCGSQMLREFEPGTVKSNQTPVRKNRPARESKARKTMRKLSD